MQAPSEPGIANVTVRLLGSGGAVLASTVTDASGYYEFDSFATPTVPGGAYTVSVTLA